MFLYLQTENKIKSFNVNQTQVFKDVLISITRDMKTSLSTTDLESYGLNTDDLVINMVTTNLNIAYKKFHSHNQTLTIQEAVGEDVLRELSSKQKEALDAINFIFQDNDSNLNSLTFRLDEIKNSC